MTKVPIRSPIAAPAGPAFGRNVVLGRTNAPQPTAQPKESAITASGEKNAAEMLFSPNFASELSSVN